ncbi:hypothetical protein RC74_12525 [Falsihalocynthiibacter arcticus]|uniref:Uncharacterized protein n=1 Tax=Falsihalocynthiibacter arcticus TaxID=1579316 RepID=A0A126V119_9RHOB|nr:hypothetical protein RC74_12525 [Falsihalocynthiibacter arcticus]
MGVLYKGKYLSSRAPATYTAKQATFGWLSLFLGLSNGSQSSLGAYMSDPVVLRFASLHPRSLAKVHVHSIREFLTAVLVEVVI